MAAAASVIEYLLSREREREKKRRSDRVGGTCFREGGKGEGKRKRGNKAIMYTEREQGREEGAKATLY